MRGNPILRVLVFALALAAMGVAVLRMTAAPVVSAPTTRPETNDAPEPMTTLVFRFESPHAPDSIQLDALGKEVARIAADEVNTPVEVRLVIPADGADVVVHASWPESADASNALRVRIDRDYHQIVDTTLWGESKIADVISIPGAGGE